MTVAWALLLGLGLGLRHALDADHVAAIGTLLHREASAGRAARLAALWGLGHSLTFLTIGLLVVVAGIRVPPHFERVSEGVIAAMLVVLGIGALVRLRSGRAGPVSGLRPLLIGVVHGLAGSAGVAILALTTIRSTVGAVGYLTLFGIGTVAGMMLLTILLSVPLGFSLRARDDLGRIAVMAAGVLSVVLGVVFGARVALQTFGTRS